MRIRSSKYLTIKHQVDTQSFHLSEQFTCSVKLDFLVISV